MLIALLYVFGSCILLEVSIIDIAFLWVGSDGLIMLALFAQTSLGSGAWVVSSIGFLWIFFDLPLGFGSPSKSFHFNEVGFSGHCSSIFAPCSNSSTKSLLVIMTCLVYGTNTWKCLLVSKL